MLNEKLNRRQFLWLSITSGAGLFAARRAAGGGFSTAGAIGANERVNVGIIGIGRRGYRHLTEYLRLPGVSVAAICDVDETKLRAISEQMSRAGLPRPFLTTDYRRLLDVSEIDVLSVATPKRRRVEIGISACEAGKHLILEKPFSASIAEGRKLVGTAAKTKRLVQQRESHAFAPLADISALTQSAELGEVRAVRGWKKVNLPHESFGRSARINDKQREAPYDELIDFAFDELDTARALLEVESPVNVTTAYFGGDSFRRVPAGIAFRFDFDRGESEKRMLNFELKFDTFKSSAANPNKSVELSRNENSFDDREEFESRSVYSTSRGELSVECSSDFARFDSENNSWENLISCVRSGNFAGLQNPISEAHKSCSLIHSAAESLRSAHHNSEKN